MLKKIDTPDSALASCLNQQLMEIESISGCIAGIGIDLLDERRIEKSLVRFKTALGNKILSENELRVWSENNQSCNQMAKYFAAKEAVVKALGTGFRRGITFKQINIERNSLGRPMVTLTGQAAIRLKQLNGRSIHLSLTDEYPWVHAIALVVC